MNMQLRRFGIVIGGITVNLVLLTGIARAGTCPARTITQSRAAMGTNNSLQATRNWAQHPVPSGASNSLGTDLVLLIAHRGEWQYCPENTIEAYEASVDEGADGVEMDLRISYPGTDTDGTSYPNGEVFLTHDYDLRGEAPDPAVQDVSGCGTTNIVYCASPASLHERGMVDRKGNAAFDSNGNPILFRSLKDLLNNIYLRAQMANGAFVLGGNAGTNIQVIRGPLVVLDVKGDENQTYANWNGTLRALTEAFVEVNQFQLTNHVDLSQMIVYKIKYNKVQPSDWTNLISTYYSAQPNQPGLIAIVYPENNTSRPANVAGFETYSGYLMTNWNVRYNGISTQQWALQDLQNGKGNSGFASVNSFPEGIRYSDGSCCDSQDLQSFSLSAFDFLFQPAGSSLPRIWATLQTVDHYQNAANYLTLLNLRNTSHLQ